MMGNKIFYSFIVLLLTVVCVWTIIFYDNQDYNKVKSNNTASNYENNDREYLGYIYDDYNKVVNLNYVDDIYVDKNEADNLDDNSSINTVALWAANLERTRDNIRMIRSERIIEEITLKNK